MNSTVTLHAASVIISSMIALGISGIQSLLLLLSSRNEDLKLSPNEIALQPSNLDWRTSGIRHNGTYVQA